MMNRIQLIVTGDMEKLALHKSLAKPFPNLEFLEPVQSQGFTSADINQIFSKVPNNTGEDREVDELVTALFNEIECRKSADMVIVIDDLETVNLDHSDLVVKYFRDAVNTYIDFHRPTQRILNRLREDCSFHLFVPMAEAYFFGEEPLALRRAGATLTSTVSGQNMDVEDFGVTNEVNYLTAPKGTSYWSSNPNDRKRHPKRYLDYLCSPQLSKNKAHYKETRGGVAALESLNWNSILSSNPNQVKYLRSLFDDISCQFGLPNPCECAFITDCKQGSVLRNI